VLTWLHRFAIFHFGYQWVFLFFGDESSYYWFHRVSHECRVFWASHVVHHSSQQDNHSTALRQTWTGSFMSFNWLWLPILGFAPVMIMTMKAIRLLYQFWIHTELVRSLGPLEAIFNTPSHHRAHHGSNPPYIDRNHGGTLIIWDRLFGNPRIPPTPFASDSPSTSIPTTPCASPFMSGSTRFATPGTLRAGARNSFAFSPIPDGATNSRSMPLRRVSLRVLRPFLP
jgi:sterol desaturase/sphingolipid hydroxylase (fatty acid hydroxylase superfamily)